MVGGTVGFAGAFDTSSLDAVSNTYGGGMSSASNVRFNAASSSAIYSKSQTVQPQSMAVQYLIKY